MSKLIINYDKLRGKIKEVLGTQINFAEKLELDNTTISNKLNSNTFFTQKEIIKACSSLNISINEIPEFFFNQKVRKDE